MKDKINITIDQSSKTIGKKDKINITLVIN